MDDGMPGVDPEFLEEQMSEIAMRKQQRAARILTGQDARIVGTADLSDTTASPTTPSAPGEAPPLAVLEERWGFGLDELRAASKVVTVLFNNPSLFVGDPYLAESRLYTMISRDRKTKRENKDVYRQVMNEEKSRRDRAQRQQDVETIKKTAMKKERDDALNALLLPPADDDDAQDGPMLLTERPGTSSAAQPTLLPEPSTTIIKGMPTTPNRGANGLDDAAIFLGANGLDDAAIFRFLGGFEASVEAENAHRTMATRDTAHWTAVALRFRPHAFGSQMPAPLFTATHSDDAATTPIVRSMLWFKTCIAMDMLSAGIEAPIKGRDGRGEPNPHQLPPWTGGTMQLTELREIAGSMPRSDPAAAALLLQVVPRLVQAVTALVAQHPTTTLGAHALCDAIVRCVAADDTARHEQQWVSMVGSAVAYLDQWMAYVLYPLASGCGCMPDGVVSTGALDAVGTRKDDATTRTPLGASTCCCCPFAALRTDLPPTADALTGESQSAMTATTDVEGRMLPAARYAREALPDEELQMHRVQKCHTCKGRYQLLHPFYYSLCRPCGEFNYHKRLMTRDLRGKCVLLTGCRIKIGYAMAVSLLRCGATLLGTTRFAHDALARFLEEPDYGEWKDRVHLFSLDLRDMWMVTQFCGFLTAKFPKLFAIINNAAQTIARTPEYTAALRQQEAAPPPALRAGIAADHKGGAEWYQFFLHKSTLPVGLPLGIEASHPSSSSSAADSPFLLHANGSSGASTTADVGTAPATTATLIPTMVRPEAQLVYDRYDTQAEAMDVREKNSWTMNLHEVQGSEAAETMAINALSPFVMNSKLKPLLMNRTGDACANEGRFIINVSAMEGQFYRFKQTTHPHTNMAKAALNMMTRTSAEDYAQDRIFMNSVDTGWITDESPVHKKQRRTDDFMLCPLDEVDAAARCLDLIYMDSSEHGKFWKDFHVIPW